MGDKFDLVEAVKGAAAHLLFLQVEHDRRELALDEAKVATNAQFDIEGCVPGGQFERVPVAYIFVVPDQRFCVAL